MNQILTKPYKTIWCSIPLILGLSIIGYNRTIDLQLHDVYFVIASMQIGVLFSIILGIIGFVYWLFRNKKLVNWMTLVHVIITISIFGLIVLTGLVFRQVVSGDFISFRTVNQFLITIILIALFSQLIFLINLVFSLIRNKKEGSTGKSAKKSFY